MSNLKAPLLPPSPPIMIEHADMYSDPLKNTIYIVFHHVAIVLSLLVNGLLFALIVKCRRKEFGAYRFLLLTFASVDIYYGLVHFFVMPIPEAWDNAFYMGAHGYITGKVAVCWFAGAHSHSFVVLVFHFLYRLLAVKGYCVLYYLYDADSFVVEYMEPILREHAIGTSLPIDQYSTAVFWTNGTFIGPRWKPIFGVFVMASTMSGGYGFMIYASLMIRRSVTFS
ncbi:hypothetical protein PMAYCL1PPCAC_05554, partial [Pristionchus mayeri]